MKNKYQEAFESIEMVVVFNKNYNDYANDLKIVQELVDKETPMKPYYNPDYPIGDCPICLTHIGDNPYCRGCGQKIDWNDDNE